MCTWYVSTVYGFLPGINVFMFVTSLLLQSHTVHHADVTFLVATPPVY